MPQHSDHLASAPIIPPPTSRGPSHIHLLLLTPPPPTSRLLVTLTATTLSPNGCHSQRPPPSATPRSSRAASQTPTTQDGLHHPDGHVVEDVILLPSANTSGIATSINDSASNPQSAKRRQGSAQRQLPEGGPHDAQSVQITAASPRDPTLQLQIASARDTLAAAGKVGQHGDVARYTNENTLPNIHTGFIEAKDSSKYSNGYLDLIQAKLDLSRASSPDSAVSLGRLSTTCLGVDATIKSRPKLEASCTYHIFPTENLTSAGAPTPLLWNPAKSSLVERRAYQNTAQYEPGLAAPFRLLPSGTTPRVGGPTPRPHTEESQRRTVEFITKEFISNGSPLDLYNDIPKELLRNKGVNAGLKANTIKPDLPSNFALQGVKTKNPQQAEKMRKAKRRLSRTAVNATRRKSNEYVLTADGKVSRKSSSASGMSDGVPSNGHISSNQGAATPENGGKLPNVGNNVPYFKFWNSSAPPQSRNASRAGKKDKVSEMDLKQLAELVLADSKSRADRDLAAAAKKILEHQQREEQTASKKGIAQGMWFDSSGRAYVSLATRYESPPK